MTIITAPRATKPRTISIDGEEVMEEVLLPKVVEEDVRLVEEQLPARGTMDELPQGRILQLKFLDRVSEPVQTGNVLRGINDECLKLALVDSAEEIVSCGPAEAEIVLLDAGNGIITHENFKRRIIKTGEKKKPHFTKRVFIDLKEGVGDLAGLQLGQDSGWTKNCYCRLGATLVQSPGGIVARSAWTLPFKVGDKRNTRNRKHESPLLSSEVWRLKGIGRNGVPSKRLEERNIETVQDFLFWLYVKPKELKQILGFGGILWKNVVTHAKECFIDDERMYSFKSSNKPQTSVVYDAVGRLKGLIKESHFVATDNMSADEKDDARELLFSTLEGSAFRERYDSPFDIEASLPQRSSGITNASLQQCSNGSLLTFSENVGGYQTRERGSSSQSILDPADVPFLDPEVTDGLLWLDNHCYPTSRPSEKDKGNVEPFNYTMHHVLMAGESSSRHSNASFCSLDSMEFLCGDDDDEYWGTNDWLSQGPPSPNSLHYYAADDTTSYDNRIYVYGNESCADEPPPPQSQVVSTSGNESCADVSTQPQPLPQPQPQDVSTSGNESCADASAQPQPQPQPRPWPLPPPQDVSTSGNESDAAASTNRWRSSFSKLLVSLREKMSLDFIRSHKKRKIG